jgi:mycofactocin precursor
MRQRAVVQATPAKPALAAGESAGGGHSSGHRSGEPVIADDLLVEEVSIDGMCGVY